MATLIPFADDATIRAELAYFVSVPVDNISLVGSAAYFAPFRPDDSDIDYAIDGRGREHLTRLAEKFPGAVLVAGRVGVCKLAKGTAYGAVQRVKAVRLTTTVALSADDVNALPPIIPNEGSWQRIDEGSAAYALPADFPLDRVPGLLRQWLGYGPEFPLDLWCDQAAVRDVSRKKLWPDGSLSEEQRVRLRNIKADVKVQWAPDAMQRYDLDVTGSPDGKAFSQLVHREFSQRPTLGECYLRYRQWRKERSDRFGTIRTPAMLGGLLAFHGLEPAPAAAVDDEGVDALFVRWITFWKSIDWTETQISFTGGRFVIAPLAEVGVARLVVKDMADGSRLSVAPDATLGDMEQHDRELCETFGVPLPDPLRARPVCFHIFATYAVDGPLDLHAFRVAQRNINIENSGDDAAPSFGFHDGALVQQGVRHEYVSAEALQQINPTLWREVRAAMLNNAPAWICRLDNGLRVEELQRDHVLSVHPVANCAWSVVTERTTVLLLEMRGTSRAKVLDTIALVEKRMRAANIRLRLTWKSALLQTRQGPGAFVAAQPVYVPIAAGPAFPTPNLRFEPSEGRCIKARSTSRGELEDVEAFCPLRPHDVHPDAEEEVDDEAAASHVVVITTDRYEALLDAGSPLTANIWLQRDFSAPVHQLQVDGETKRAWLWTDELRGTDYHHLVYAIQCVKNRKPTRFLLKARILDERLDVEWLLQLLLSCPRQVVFVTDDPRVWAWARADPDQSLLLLD